MPDIWAQLPDTFGLALLVFAAFLAGVIRGFSGFGTAMFFLPLAAIVIEPVWAVLALTGMDILGPLPVVRQISKDARRTDLMLLLGGAALLVPVGVWLLTVISPEIYRYAVCIVTFGLVVCLMYGLRYRGEPTRPLMAGAGAVSGVVGGMTGLPGPPVILLYMASAASVLRVRATTMLFLLGFEVLLLVTFLVTGRFELLPFAMGLALAIPNGLGIWIGQLIFDPEKETVYRNIAYIVVTGAAILGLPIWD